MRNERDELESDGMNVDNTDGDEEGGRGGRLEK